MGVGAGRGLFRGVLGLCWLLSLFPACSSNKSEDSAVVAQGASPESLATESVKNIGTLLARTTGEMMEVPGAVFGTKAVSSGRGWYCPADLVYENDCMKITGACAARGPAVDISGKVEFKSCLRETRLGLAAFMGSASFQATWDFPPSCVRERPDASCPSSPVTIKLSDPADLVVRYAETDTVVITALRAVLEEAWRMANQGLWRMTLEDFRGVSSGRVFECSGSPVSCAVGPVAPEAPPREPLDQTCLNIPDDCGSDQDCQNFLAACPDTAEFLAGFNHELRCVENQSRGGKSCFSRKIQPPDGGENPPTAGSCTRSPNWMFFCPISLRTAVNGQGMDCGSDADCRGPAAVFDDFGGTNPCRYSCESCPDLSCGECQACIGKLFCASGCCGFDEDGDGYIYGGGGAGDGTPNVIREREDNCTYKSNPDQTDTDLDCIGDACDNCPTVVNGYDPASGPYYAQTDFDNDGVGDACDNCRGVFNGPNPRWVCEDKACREETLPPELVQKDSDGDGKGDACQGDEDGDGIPNEQDNCPAGYGNPPNPDQSDSDLDDAFNPKPDGVGDPCDNCPRTYNPDQTDVMSNYDHHPDGRGDACQGDLDEDRIPDKEGDNCPFDFNPGQEDGDADGYGDLCDICPAEYDPTNSYFACNEPDGDGVPSESDNCPKVWNPDQASFNGNTGFPGQACGYCLMSESPWGWDPDADGVMDDYTCDNCQGRYNPDQKDTDGDLIGDACDNCPAVKNYGQKDTDGNGQGDACPSVCGNFEIEVPFEECDDGNLVDGDGCDSNCTVTACGNGIVTPETKEECETESAAQDCAASPGALCTFECTCKVPVCGDGYPDSGESCDDGNLDPNDNCTDACVPNVCGDGISNPPSDVCEPGTLSCEEGLGCSQDCQWVALQPGCGNGCLDPGEACDDGNVMNGDGCDSTCTCACDPGNYCDAADACQSCEVQPVACTGDAQCMDIARQCGAPPSMRFVCEITDGAGVCIPDCTEFETNCHDGIDNDCDGLLECQKGGDPDCAVYDPEGCGIRPPPTDPCGDGQCTCRNGENPKTCPQDCTNEIGLCHDGIDNDCDGLWECVPGGDPDCPADDPTICVPAVCGNGTCDCAGGENFSVCPEDCPAFETNCNDGIDNDCDARIECTPAEQDCLEITPGTPEACPSVPPPPPEPKAVCPDGICNGTETCDTCPQDCLKCVVPLPVPK